MPRQKRTSRVLERAEIRISGFKAVDPAMDFGDSRSLIEMGAEMRRLRDRLESYNRALAEVDSSKKDIDELEKRLADLIDRMLIGVAFKYGKDSREYEMAGGMRKSDRIRKSSTARIRATKEAKPVGEIEQSA